MSECSVSVVCACVRQSGEFVSFVAAGHSSVAATCGIQLMVNCNENCVRYVKGCQNILFL